MSLINIREGLLEEIVELRSKIPEFDLPFDKAYFENRYNDKEKLLLIAEQETANVGFIVAYDRDNDGSLYCWMAGVLPEYRNQGTFGLLMKFMNKWAKEKGYKRIKVKTHNKFREMLTYLVKNQFNFTLVETSQNILDNSIHVEKEL